MVNAKMAKQKANKGLTKRRPCFLLPPHPATQQTIWQKVVKLNDPKVTEHATDRRAEGGTNREIEKKEHGGREIRSRLCEAIKLIASQNSNKNNNQAWPEII